jgi:hypothetical protein
MQEEILKAVKTYESAFVIRLDDQKEYRGDDGYVG